jgi:hypothetical protein
MSVELEKSLLNRFNARQAALQVWRRASMSWYSATPMGLLESRRAYSATTLFLLLQSSRPMVGASWLAFICASMLE